MKFQGKDVVQVQIESQPHEIFRSAEVVLKMKTTLKRMRRRKEARLPSVLNLAAAATHTHLKVVPPARFVHGREAVVVQRAHVDCGPVLKQPLRSSKLALI